VLIVDDVIATGGTAGASASGCSSRPSGPTWRGFSVFIELVALDGRSALDGVPFHALLVRLT
jgi:adenine/guanine phosphoribosyltransferase-like PRPP-binding protein